MADVLLLAPTGGSVIFEQFGVRRAIRIAAQRRQVNFREAESIALRHLARHADRSAAISAGFTHLETLGHHKQVSA